jgi:hypothetical protein
MEITMELRAEDFPMGKFDESINWLSKQVANATQALGDLKSGHKIEINDKDISDQLKATHEGLIKRYEQLIAAYRKRDE